MDWASRLMGGDLAALWVIEGVATYGTRLSRIVTDAGYEVAEAPRVGARGHRRVGKSDFLDAHRIGAAVLPLENDRLHRPRSDDEVRPALRVLTTAREQMSTEHTANINALTALLRTAELGLDARKPLTSAQNNEVLALSTARAEARRLAKRVRALDAELAENRSHLEEALRQSKASSLLELAGVGPVTAAVA
ncbi:transposase [Kocuria sp. p3-SID1433]|uniref:IS110 family transposase n=1 Tax=unclassified Kocuria TaxID=2649579 RepID=UPI0021A69560|nr:MULTISPECIES: transposase [unclassified Kocuria]MCT1601378.1 transposase [Kocuria sp. p3-SID1428]MCT2180881.1 transposase [Kocuria sp. p3-SID1433]